MLLLWALASGWGPGVGAAGATTPKPSQKPSQTPGLDHGQGEQEVGASALIDASPLQLGLKENGLPEPVEPTGQGDGTPVVPTPASPPPRPRLLVLDRRHRLLRVLENGQEVRRYPVAVGMPGWETPVGEFTVIEKTVNPKWEHPAYGNVLPPGPTNPLGSRWIGFYRDCRGRSGFNGQEHLVVKGCVTAGFHGTPNRSSVGRAVSHGCVRLFDEHAKELFDLVSLGTPVKVLP
ncbi:MAG: L,D-transpeptidase [Cyanobacteriota bacterium]|nr:L,D-transpeptidase [Cyanobacteriota bacterium]